MPKQKITRHVFRIFASALVAGFLFLIASLPTNAQFVKNIVFPVNGENTFSDDFGNARGGGTREHEANDIIASKMTPIVSATDGVVSYITIPEAYWGYALYVRADDGWQYRYLHINNDTPGTDDGNGGVTNAFAPGIERGVRVSAGQHIAYVGDSGNAESTVSHLHFEIRRPDGTAINPYESLLAATNPRLVSPTGEIVETVIVVPVGGVLIKYADNPKVYLLADKTKHHIADEGTFVALHFDWNNITTIADSETYRTGVPLKVTDGVKAIYADGSPIEAAETPTTVRFIFTQDLSLGSENGEVSELQRVLASLGYYTYPSITGYFGPITEEAVRAFQREQGISAIGIVGPQTRAALNGL